MGTLASVITTYIRSNVDPALIPNNGIALLTEANSIINHYVPLVAANFVNNQNPPIAPVIRAPQLLRVHHANIVLHAAIRRIQNPNDANYPALTGLPSGSYICNVMVLWGNVWQTITLYKP